MHRHGKKAEDWIAEHLTGSPTINSGAKFCDGDWRTKFRLYEVKERENDNSIVIRGNAFNNHLQRARRETLGPAFMVMTKSNWVYFIVPPDDFLMSARAAVYVDHQLIQQYEAASHIITNRGSSLKIDSSLVEELRANNIPLLKCIRKDRDMWVMIEGHEWLKISGESKNPYG